MKLRRVHLLAVLLTILCIVPTKAQTDLECISAHRASLYSQADCGALNHWAFIIAEDILAREPDFSPAKLNQFGNMAEARTKQRGLVAYSLFELADHGGDAAYESYLRYLVGSGKDPEDYLDVIEEQWGRTNSLLEAIYKDGVLTALAGLFFIEHGAEVAINFMDAIILEIWELRERGFSSEETFYELDVWLNETLGLDNLLQRSITCFVSAIRSGTNIRSRPSTSSVRLEKMASEYYEVIGGVIGDEGRAWWQLAQGGFVRHDVVSETDACKDLH